MGYIMMSRRVLCRPIETEETMPGGRVVLLPDTREGLSAGQAEVVAVGPDCDPQLVPGAWVVLRQWQPVGIGDGLFVVREDDIVAALNIRRD